MIEKNGKKCKKKRIGFCADTFFLAFPILRCLFYRVNQFFQLLIGNGADVFLYELAVFEESEGRNAHDFKGSCQLRCFVNVYFVELDLQMCIRDR